MAELTRDDILRRIAASGHIQLPGADLAGLDLSGLTLAGADLSYSDLSGADLSHAQLPGACLWSVQARGARFRCANLCGASLGLAVLVRADMRDAQMDGVDLTGAKLDGADLTGSDLRGAWLDAMQRALAVGAPPLRFSPEPGTRTRVLNQGDAVTAVALRCGERLELRLNERPGRSRIEQSGAPGRAVLTGPDACAYRLNARHLTFLADAPGRARVVITTKDASQCVTLDVLVTE